MPGGRRPKLNGSPNTLARREEAAHKKKDQRARKNAGTSWRSGRPRKADDDGTPKRIAKRLHGVPLIYSMSRRMQQVCLCSKWHAQVPRVLRLRLAQDKRTRQGQRDHDAASFAWMSTMMLTTLFLASCHAATNLCIASVSRPT